MKKAKIGDIISYHNQNQNKLYFHEVLSVNEEDYTSRCISDPSRYRRGYFGFKTPHIIINKRLIKLLW